MVVKNKRNRQKKLCVKCVLFVLIKKKKITAYRIVSLSHLTFDPEV